MHAYTCESPCVLGCKVTSHSCLCGGRCRYLVGMEIKCIFASEIFRESSRKVNGSVAQLNRASDYGSEGYRFESCRGHHGEMRHTTKGRNGSVAQLNRASDYGSEGYRFESCRGHHQQKRRTTRSSTALFFYRDSLHLSAGGASLFVEGGEAKLQEVEDVLEAFGTAVVGVGNVVAWTLGAPFGQEADLACGFFGRS